MKKFELLSHTADVRIHALGDSPEELFRAALEGLCEVIIPAHKKRKTTYSKEIAIDSPDVTALLIDFLSDALSIMHSGKVMLPEVEFKALDEMYLRAELSGFEVDEFHEDVKAVTYHEANIVENPEGVFETIVVLDI